MRPIKRVEILTGLQEFPLVEKVLENQGITGYMVVQNVRGIGNRQLASVDLLTGEPTNRLIKTACPPDRIGDLVKAIRPILLRYGGTCIVYDAECLVLSHQHDPQTGELVQAEE